MASVSYQRLDVFTETAYAGNPLAVCVDPPPLGDRAMQRIAAELNLSETVFVRSPSRAGAPWPTRIFTPTTELPFAGHPTVGTAILLAELGLVAGRLVLAEPIGDVPIEIVDGAAHLELARLPALEADLDRDDAAGLLGLAGGDLADGLEPGVWSAGVPFAVVPLNGIDALARAGPRTGAEHQLYPVVRTGDHAWRARMFAPSFGIAEDPGTGAAAAALGGLLARLEPGDGTHGWQIDQGVEMGRPCRIDVTTTITGGELSRVTIGGRAVVVGSGTLTAIPT